MDFEGEGGKKCFSDFFPSEFSVFPEKLFWEKFSYLFFDSKTVFFLNVSLWMIDLPFTHSSSISLHSHSKENGLISHQDGQHWHLICCCCCFSGIWIWSQYLAGDSHRGGWFQNPGNQEYHYPRYPFSHPSHGPAPAPAPVPVVNSSPSSSFCRRPRDGEIQSDFIPAECREQEGIGPSQHHHFCHFCCSLNWGTRPLLLVH